MGVDKRNHLFAPGLSQRWVGVPRKREAFAAAPAPQDVRSVNRGGSIRRAFAVKVATKRHPVFPFSGFDLYHHFRNDASVDLYNLLEVLKTGKREVVLLQPLPQTLYPRSSFHEPSSA